MTVGLSYLGDTSRVRIAVSDRPNGAVSVERSTNQLFWQSVRGGLALPLVGGGATLDDWEFADSVQNFYRITQVALEDAVDAFTSSGTWNKPPGLTAVKVTVVGPGGGGGGAAATGVGQASVGNGGAPGVIAFSVIDAAALGASETVTVGTGGVGNLGATGGAGSAASSFGAHVSANAGSGGGLFAASNVNEAGTGTAQPTTGTGQVVFSGTPGGGALKFIGLGNGGLRGGDGGSGSFGSGGRGGINLGNGNAATGFGAGGGGATSTPSSGARTGGNGSGGLVLVENIFA